MVFVVLAVVIAGAVIIGTGGGNTVSGFGEDMENTGRKIENSAE